MADILMVAHAVFQGHNVSAKYHPFPLFDYIAHHSLFMMCGQILIILLVQTSYGLYYHHFVKYVDFFLVLLDLAIVWAKKVDKNQVKVNN